MLIDCLVPECRNSDPFTSPEVEVEITIGEVGVLHREDVVMIQSDDDCLGRLPLLLFFRTGDSIVVNPVVKVVVVAVVGSGEERELIVRSELA